MISQYAQDFKDPTVPLREAINERGGKPLKMRFQPAILRVRPKGDLMYVGWKQVRWTLEIDTVEEALVVRDTLRLFFETLTSKGPDAVRTLLLNGEGGGKGAAA